MTTHYIGADVHKDMTDLAVERNGQIVRQYEVPTTIPSLRATLTSVPRPRMLTFEEGSMAGWLARELSGSVDRLLVCDPLRNRLIDSDGDKDNGIDARKLAALLRGGYLREVYHSQDDAMADLKEWVRLYHDRVKDAVRQVNKLWACCRGHGLRAPGRVRHNKRPRQQWLRALGEHRAAAQLRMLFAGYDTAVWQVAHAARQMLERAERYEVFRLWQGLPGVGPIRAATVLAYLQSPARFVGKASALWKYCGVGLQRSASGTDRKGRPKAGHLQLAWRVNRRLKDAIVGAAVTAIEQGDNVFAAGYERRVGNGLSEGNARHTVARKLLSVMVGMWKTRTPFDPSYVWGW